VHALLTFIAESPLLYRYDTLAGNSSPSKITVEAEHGRVPGL
jgi:hypothetical protein